MDILKKVVNRKIKNINEGISNISQQEEIKHHEKEHMHKYQVLMIMNQLVEHMQKFQKTHHSNLNNYQNQKSKITKTEKD